MSCNYADMLSDYENKGICGTPEIFDSKIKVEEKCQSLVALIQQAKHVVVHTGAGISTPAGIPDFRGPNGVWTLEQKGKKPICNTSFNDAKPTFTHMALRELVHRGYVHYIVSQNIDGLHLKSGLGRSDLAELHGNMFVEQCNKCRRQFVRATASETLGQKPCGGTCRAGKSDRACRGGILLDNVLDWEDDLPERDLNMALMQSTLADLNITLGTTLQILPSGNLPLKNKRHGGKLVICNLQVTKHDKKADLIINAHVDEIISIICKRLGIKVPEYSTSCDPTKRVTEESIIEWTLPIPAVKSVEKLFTNKQKELSAERKINRLKRAKSPDSKPLKKKVSQTMIDR